MDPASTPNLHYSGGKWRISTHVITAKAGIQSEKRISALAPAVCGLRGIAEGQGVAKWISPVVLLDGRVIGTWPTGAGRRRELKIAQFKKLSKKVWAMIEKEAEAFGVFVGASPRVVLSGSISG